MKQITNVFCDIVWVEIAWRVSNGSIITQIIITKNVSASKHLVNVLHTIKTTVYRRENRDLLKTILGPHAVRSSATCSVPNAGGGRRFMVLIKVESTTRTSMMRNPLRRAFHYIKNKTATLLHSDSHLK
jgi:hypothetical protein